MNPHHYADLGYAVFPCKPDKSPQAHPDDLLHGLSDATDDPTQIAIWWERWPDAPIGLLAPDFVAIIDLDSKNGTRDGIGELNKHAPPGKRIASSTWPGPWQATATGGSHVPMIVPTGSRLKVGNNILPGVDIKGLSKGYIIVAPSVTEDGSYEWLHPLCSPAEIPRMPDWVYNILETAQAATNRGRTADTNDIIRKGSRDETLFAIGCKLRAQGKTSDEILTELHSINKLRCVPPLPDRIVVQKANSASRYEQGPTDEGIDEFLGNTVPEPAIMAIMPAATDKPPPMREILYKLAFSGIKELFKTPDGDPYALVHENGIKRPLPIKTRGNGVRDWLSRKYQSFAKVPTTKQAITEAVQALADQAMSPDSKTRPVFRRVAHVGSAIYVDIGDSTRKAIKITSDGWAAVDAPPDLLFLRDQRMAALPVPIRPALHMVELMEQLVGEGITREGCVLVCAWLLGTFSKGPFPLLMITAPQGSGKTSMARMVKRMVDPVNGYGVSAAIKDPKDLVAVADCQHVLCVDNISHVTSEISDTLACISTGADFGGRKLYTDNDSSIVNIKRPIVLTSILDVVKRGDLADRCISINLSKPPQRLSEAEMDWRFNAVAPELLGALLDAVAIALREYNNTPAPQTRMADFAQWVTAGCHGLGFKAAEFSESYQDAKKIMVESVLETDPVAAAVIDLANESKEWVSSLLKLSERLARHAGDEVKSRAWPAGPKAMANALKRIAPMLEDNSGILVFSRRTTSKREWVVRLKTTKPSNQDKTNP